MHPTTHPDCRLCWLWDTDARYRKLWGGDPATVTPATAATAPHRPRDRTAACVHRGRPTGETRVCESCTGRVSIKLYGCQLHERCSIERDVGAAVCATCPDYVAQPDKVR
jgi:hypothetical protein